MKFMVQLHQRLNPVYKFKRGRTSDDHGSGRQNPRYGVDRSTDKMAGTGIGNGQMVSILH